MKKITQIVSGAFLIGLSPIGLAGPDCVGGSCDKATVATTIATEGKEACIVACDKDALVAVAEGQERVHFVTTGMSCGSCKDTISASLAKLEGVKLQKVCSKSGSIVVDFVSATTPKTDVAAAINQGEIAIAAERITVPVAGMTCGSCTGKVTEALNSIDGLVVQKVCHKSGTAVVDVDTSKSNRDAIVKTIVDNGYKAS